MKYAQYLTQILGAPFDIIYNGDRDKDRGRPKTESYKLFLRTISSVNKEESLQQYDATNACQFLAIDICDSILLSKDVLNHTNIVTQVQDIILTRPKVYNRVRDRTKTYEVNDALSLLGNPLINNGIWQFQASTSTQLGQSISTSIFKALTKSRQVYHFCFNGSAQLE